LDLARARSRVAAERVRVQGGADPATEHRVAASSADDFGAVAIQFIQRYAKPKNRGWKETARLIGLIPDPTNPSDDPATFVAHKDGAVKKWGHRKVADITRADINRHLDGIVDRGSPIAANRVFAALRKMFGWAELDLEKKLWTLPRGRVKNDKGHEVPLSAQAIKVIRSVPKVAGRDMLFTTTGESPISGFSKTKVAIDEQSGVADWTFHDLR